MSSSNQVPELPTIARRHPKIAIKSDISNKTSVHKPNTSRMVLIVPHKSSSTTNYKPTTRPKHLIIITSDIIMRETHVNRYHTNSLRVTYMNHQTSPPNSFISIIKFTNYPNKILHMYVMPIKYNTHLKDILDK